MAERHEIISCHEKYLLALVHFGTLHHLGISKWSDPCLYTEHEQKMRINFSEMRRRTEAITEQGLSLLNVGTESDSIIRDVVRDFLSGYEISPASVMAMVSAEATGTSPARAMSVASAVQFVETAAKMHRVIYDSGMNSEAGGNGFDKLVILAGDLLMAESTRIIALYGSPTTMAILGTGLTHLLEYYSWFSPSISVNGAAKGFDILLQRERSGTVKFVGDAAIVGGLTGRLDRSLVDHYRHLAESFAIAYYLQEQAQKIDRLLQNGATLEFGLDAINVPLIYAFCSCSSAPASTIVSEMESGDVASVIRAMSRYRVIDCALETSARYLHDVHQRLEQIRAINREPLFSIFL